MINLFFFTIIIKLFIVPLVTAYHNSTFIINQFILFFPDLILILICFLLYIKETDKKKNFLSLLILFQVLIVILSNSINDISLIDSLKNISRTLLPICLIYFLSFQKIIIPREKLEKLGISLIVIILLLNIYAFINFNPEMNRGIEFLPNYFGGVHASSYILLASYFIIFVIYQTSIKSILFKIFLTIYSIFCVYMFMFGWGVRTIILSFLIFHILYYLSKKNFKNPFSNFMIINISTIILIIILIQFNVTFFDKMDLLTSGRLSMYDEKFSLIKNFTITELLIGKGFGSDLIFTEEWWWAPLGSHNDFISLFFENGLLFLFLFIITLINIYKLLQSNLGRSIFLTIIFTSIVSNGFFVRPISMYIMVMVFIILNNHIKIVKNV